MKRNICLLLFLLFITFFIFACEKDEQKQLIINYHYDLESEVVQEIVEDLNSYMLLEPTRKGHEFMAWYSDLELTKRVDDNNLKQEFNDKTTLDLYAEWYVMNYKVSFYCEQKLVATRSVAYLDNAIAPTPIMRPGYRFIGWDVDFTNVSCDLVVHAIYEELDLNGIIFVVLGYYLNNDGSMAPTLKTRLDLALDAYDIYQPDYIVLSGGVANSNAGISEAHVMRNYLINQGLDEGILLEESRSLSTYQNAQYTIKLLEDYEFSELVIISTKEHFTNYPTLDYFTNALNNNVKLKNKDIEILTYTNE